MESYSKIQLELSRCAQILHNRHKPADIIVMDDKCALDNTLNSLTNTTIDASRNNLTNLRPKESQIVIRNAPYKWRQSAAQRYAYGIFRKAE